MVASVSLAGCQDRAGASSAAQVVQQTVTALAARDYQKARVNLTGEALSAVDDLLPSLEKAKLETKISDFKTVEAQANGDQAEVRAHYVQEQAVPGYGSAVDNIDALFHLVKIKDQWRIAWVHVLTKE